MTQYLVGRGNDAQTALSLHICHAAVLLRCLHAPRLKQIQRSRPVLVYTPHLQQTSFAEEEEKQQQQQQQQQEKEEEQEQEEEKEEEEEEEEE
eukprot:SAG11_NODE_1121_length_5789_cov_2.695079_1_plen_92_part_10